MLVCPIPKSPVIIVLLVVSELLFMIVVASVGLMLIWLLDEVKTVRVGNEVTNKLLLLPLDMFVATGLHLCHTWVLVGSILTTLVRSACIVPII